MIVVFITVWQRTIVVFITVWQRTIVVFTTVWKTAGWIICQVNILIDTQH